MICTYNYSRFVLRAIRSVQAQSYPDWECIVVDDASTDDTAAVIARVAAEDSRIRYLRNARNLGVGASRNIGNSVAQGKWIAVLDADDWWDPNKLKAQLEAVRARRDAVLCFTSQVVVNEDREQVQDCPEAWVRDLDLSLRVENLILHSSVLISRDAIIEAGGYDERLLSAHDWNLYLELLHRHGPGSFIYVDQPIAYYRVHGSSIRSNWRRMISDERRIIRRFLARGAWGVRHPSGTRLILDGQLSKEKHVLESLGIRYGAFLRACLIAGLGPFQRSRWREVGRQLARLTFGVRSDCGGLVRSG